MSEELKPCPFCGSTNLKSGGDDKIVGTWCLDCEATGPNQYGRHEWNTRAEADAMVAAAFKSLKDKLVPAMRVDATACAKTHPEISHDRLDYAEMLEEILTLAARADARAALDRAMREAREAGYADGYDEGYSSAGMTTQQAIEKAKPAWALQYLSDESEHLEEIDKAVEADRERLGPIAQLLPEAVAEAEKAMARFPQPNYVISKWAEETGEVTKAMIHYAEGRDTAYHVLQEVTQVLAMLHRLMVEGDEVHGMEALAQSSSYAATRAPQETSE